MNAMSLPIRFVPSSTGNRRTRLDRLVVDRGLAPTRERALRLILAGQVVVDGVTVSKAGHLVPLTATVGLREPDHPYVSRGGVKLAHALKVFQISVEGRIVVDVGASTGGFTHCLLLQGARRVYAVDVGRGQLDAGLRADPRVSLLEGVNARALTREVFPELPDLATIDVSFIGVEKILPALVACLTPPGEIVALIKPQFETGRSSVGKGGVVRDTEAHRAVLARLAEAIPRLGLFLQRMTASPILGPKGNREFFFHLSEAPPSPALNTPEAIDRVLNERSRR